MVIKKDKIKISDIVSCCGGVGNAEIGSIIGNGELVCVCTVAIEGESTVGYHEHSGDNELYYIVNGSGIYNDNGVDIIVSAGDVTICYDGESHGLKTDGGKLLFVAVVYK